tara:strand:- start:311 stop:709 length:399 start_codon:yes stop_codon:yes gene_type:complete
METKQINFIGLDPVSDLVKTWVNTLATFNPEAVVNLYAPDGILLGTIAENIKVGRDEILTYFNMFVQKQPVGMINTMYIQDGGSCKVADGIYTFTLTDSLGKKTEVIARYTFVFKQYMDEWKIASHHSSKQP